MKKTILIGLIFVMLVEPWFVSLLYCELLTAKHYDTDLYEACNANSMVGEIETLKILEYKPFSYCKVYGKSDEMGNVFMLTYAHDNDQSQWEVIYWDTIWSKNGNANGFVWPYIR